MSRSIPTEQEVFDLAIAYFQTAHRDPVTGRAPPLGPRSFSGQQARALAQLIGEVLAYGKSIDDDAVPNVYYDASGVLRTRNSSLVLDDWADVFGLPSSVAGKFGRRGATSAKNGGASGTGTVGTIVPTGSQLTDPSGTVTLQLRVGITIPIGGVQPVVLDAVTQGSVGRLPVGTILRWSSPPPGLVTTTTLTSALTGGGDIESDIELALRIVARLRNRPRGGSAYDFREWAEFAEDSTGLLIGVKRAYVYPVRDGAGSVTVVPLFGGSGQARDPGAVAVGKIQTWLNGLKIATDTVYVVRPRFVSGEALTIELHVDPMPGYAMDWQDTMTLTGVGGTGTSLVVDLSPPPPSLLNAITNGTKPRIAMNFPGAALPFVARCTAYALDTPMAGKTTLTLDTALPAMVASIRVHPAGGMTLPVAAAVADYVDNLGPSRSSGLADPNDPWEDNVTVAKLAAVTLAATDPTSGERVCRTSPGVGVGVGVTIQIGAGVATAADYQIFDNVPGQGPQLAELAAIVVRQA